MFITLALASAFAAQEAPPAPTMSWDEPRRYYLQSEVRLPYLMWFTKQFNEQARVTAFQIRMVTTCEPGVEMKRRREVLCTLDDVAIRAAGVSQEEGLLQPILEELDERLTGAVVQLEVRPDGRLENIDLEEIDRRNRRVGRMNENLRLMVSRAFAGLDLPMSRHPEDAQWVQHDAWLLKAPAAQGSVGSAQLVHEWGETQGSRRQVVSGGRAIIVPAGSGNQYDTRMTSEAWFDIEQGVLTDRSWLVAGYPTASSVIAEGPAGYPYLQAGRVSSLALDQTHPVGETEALPPLNDDPSALQQWQTLGLLP